MYKIKKTHLVKRCVTDGRTDRQTYGQRNRTDFIGPLPQGWRFDHVFRKFENNIFLNYLP